MGLNVELSGAGVLTLSLAFGPVNAVSTPMRRELLKALMRADQDVSVKAVVITGCAGFFSAGADLVEFNEGRSFDYPNFHAVVLPYILGMSKPVVAAINGRAIGGGFELALWCHARVADRDAQVGLPETSLGLIPGAGGTQLLPRALGLEEATALIVSGAVKPALTFADTPLFDEVVTPEQVVPVATELALRMADTGRPFPHLSQQEVLHPEPMGFLQFARAQARARKDFVPSMITAIDAISVALNQSLLEGSVREFEMFRPLVASPEARAIRHAFFAERASAGIDDMPAGMAPRPLQRAAVLGAGYMGSGIAHCLARAGLDVLLYDLREGAAQAEVDRLKTLPELAQASVTAVNDLERLSGVNIVIEAVVEDLVVKQGLFRELDRVMSDGTVLASNTSTLDLDAIASATRRPQDVVGLHFFGPAPVMKLLEVVRGKATSHEVLATAMSLAKRLRKVPVVSRVGPGFIANRIYSRFMEQAMNLAAQGVSPDKVDRALERFGWRMGPFRTMDLIGHDVLAKSRLPGAAPGPGERLQDQLILLGRLGQKTGKGWYAYSPQARQGVPDAQVQALLPDAPSMEEEEVVQRCMLAMINEAAKVLHEGIAQRASDIDLSFLLGYGFPRLKGGPLFYAQEIGLPVLIQRLERLHNSSGDPVWIPSPLLIELSKTTGQFKLS